MLMKDVQNTLTLDPLGSSFGPGISMGKIAPW